MICRKLGALAVCVALASGCAEAKDKPAAVTAPAAPTAPAPKTYTIGQSEAQHVVDLIAAEMQQATAAVQRDQAILKGLTDQDKPAEPKKP